MFSWHFGFIGITTFITLPVAANLSAFPKYIVDFFFEATTAIDFLLYIESFAIIRSLGSLLK